MRAAAVGIALVAVLLATGCGKEPGMQPTITAEQATSRVAEIIAETHRHLPPGATLKPRGGVGTLPCDDPTDGGPAGRVFIEEEYELEFAPEWPVDRAIPDLAAFWKERGFRVTKDFRGHDTNAELAVEYPDGFRTGVQLVSRDSGLKDAYIWASSICVWPHGTPA